MKLSKPVYLLILLIEESAEVIQRTCKAIRFGLYEKQNTSSGVYEENNQIRLDLELTDLKAAEFLCRKAGILPEYKQDEQAKRITTKLEKIEKYMNYSRKDCRTLVDEAAPRH